jgi:tetratricopeptide (TPR) repeat protein
MARSSSGTAGIIVACALAGLVAAAPLAMAGQRNTANVADLRFARLEQWLKAVMRHQPGEADEAARLVASWSDADVRTLRIDINVVEQIMRAPGSAGPVFEFTIPGQAKPTLTRYVGDQYRRMADLACAAGGYVVGSSAVPRNLAGMCYELKATDALDADLRRLAVAVDDARIHGDHDNYILRRGALLHADIAMLVLRPGEAHTTDGAGTLDAGVTLAISDGEGTPDVRPIAIHWAVARMLLDNVVPPGAAAVAPGHDDMVRQWYRATATWMQRAQQYQTEHLSHARALFPQDADILFLSGWAHETYAGPAIQSAVQSASLPAGVVLDVASDRNELRAAERFFRGALAARPAFGEAHLRLGRVLVLRGRAADAVVELQQAIASLQDERLLYYAELFSGAAQEAMGQFDLARTSYEKAVKLSAAAQSPRLALSALARRVGDRAGALRALQDVFELPEGSAQRDEPWWSYFAAQARNADILLDELRKPFLEHSQ